MRFGEEYTRYWSSAVNKSVDGTIIAGANEAKYFLQYMGIKRVGRALDLGCSFGRMHEALAAYCDRIYGVDPDAYAVGKASLKPYIEVRQGTAENAGFENDFFDAVFCWAVFDVVDHKRGLAEINRVLRNDGKLLLTGKNDNYFPDDILAYRAEKNAFLKGFPNKFTDLSAVFGSLNNFGFELDKLFIFPRRGDFGLLNFVEQKGDSGVSHRGYEYLILCHKIADLNAADLPRLNLEGRFSRTANEMAARAGFQSAEEFFESIGVD